MVSDRISIHTDDLAQYATRSGTLSDDVRSAADTHLGGVSVSPTMFGDLGHETGMHNAVSEHLTRIHGHVHTIAGHVQNLGHAVHGAKGDYEANEDLAAHRFGTINEH